MAMPQDIDARRYYRVAFQRLEDGTLLLEKLDRPTAAVYLAGYAVECILKALLLTVTPARSRRLTLQSFRGTLAHDLLWLRDRLIARAVRPPPAEGRELTYVASWSTDLRYEPGPGDREDAERFLRATRAVLKWANGRI